MSNIDHLSVTITFFKSNGKYYSEDEVLIPNNLSMLDRRKFLENHINAIRGNEPFCYVSLDSNVLGFPFMRQAKRDWYENRK